MNLLEYIDPMINILHVVTWYILYSIDFLNYSGWQGVDAVMYIFDTPAICLFWIGSMVFHRLLDFL